MSAFVPVASGSGIDHQSSSDSDHSDKEHLPRRAARNHGTNETPANMTVKYRVDKKNQATASFRKTDAGDYDCLCGLRFPGRSEVEKHLNPPEGMLPLDLGIHNKSDFQNRYKTGKVK